MLVIEVPDAEYFDDSSQEFVKTKGFTLKLQHSLVSLSKWEYMFEKAFLGKQDKSNDEMYAYLECMVLNEDEVPENPINHLGASDIQKIRAHIEKRASASYLNKPKTAGGPMKETVTSDLIYYWMIALQIPMECQYWHLNRLLMLIEITHAKNEPAKKGRGPARVNGQDRRALNEQRRQQTGTKG